MVKKFKPATSSAKKFVKKSPYKEANWIEYRIKFLKHNPKCYCCPAYARVVDHIFAHKGDDEKFWQEGNFLPLCKTCHSTITQLFDRFTPPKTAEKLAWLKRQRISNDINTRVVVVPI